MRARGSRALPVRSRPSCDRSAHSGLSCFRKRLSMPRSTRSTADSDVGSPSSQSRSPCTASKPHEAVAPSEPCLKGTLAQGSPFLRSRVRFRALGYCAIVPACSPRSRTDHVSLSGFARRCVVHLRDPLVWGYLCETVLRLCLFRVRTARGRRWWEAKEVLSPSRVLVPAAPLPGGFVVARVGRPSRTGFALFLLHARSVVMGGSGRAENQQPIHRHFGPLHSFHWGKAHQGEPSSDPLSRASPRVEKSTQCCYGLEEENSADK